MKTRVYLNDWIINAGIVGFLRILEHNNDNFAIIKDNYIEFDTENLRNFHHYYFKYFFDKYNIAQSVIDKTKIAFDYLENNIENVKENKDEEKQRKENIKMYKDRIDKIINPQVKKVEKVDKDIFDEMKDSLTKLKKVETKDKIIKIKNLLLKGFKIDAVNKKITFDKFRSELYNTYYGQKSFLQKNRVALPYEDKENFMYRDYISNIVEMDFIQGIIENKYSIEKIKKYIEEVEHDGTITKDVYDIYETIIKFIEKEKDVAYIQKYLREKVINLCSICENEFGLSTDYSEGNFVPLAISNDNAKNFFWNQNVKFPICDVCKLILFCIAAGTTNITKVVKENDRYIEKQLVSFVNCDTDVKTLLKTNNEFSNNSKYENKTKNPYTQLILNIIEQNNKISNWQLENIFVVEFETEYGAYSRVEYFNIKRYVAEFFTKYAQKYLAKITDYKYKLQIVDYILKNKDIKYIINERLRDALKEENPNVYNSFLAIQTRMTLNLLKKEETKMDNIDKNNSKLYVLYSLGNQIHEELKKTGEDNKLSGYTYKMLNSIKMGNKKQFMDIVIRIHMSIGKDVSPIFVETMQDTDLDFESIGHSFLAGLISNKYEKKAEENA